MKRAIFTLQMLLLAACGSARRDAALVGPIALQKEEERAGRRLYFRHCDQCHPTGAAGLGPALNDKPLPDLAVRTQIRKGVGAMPGFDEKIIDDRGVDAIVAYVERLRKTRAPE